ncbi:hypothetical protein [Yinghuangia soli]|uniref:Uncharacterized protein n=1 Tax=Yinghuangia soli TaxID=2908204 RepID=A0AA41U3D7_9ACTN|nr:hypothetical protein [Yinghuangia soli]MCF2531720.1 hypothetical protein [Yinghuangia soli]
MWPVILMACGLASLALLAWMPVCAADYQRREKAANPEPAELPPDVSPMSPERCELCTPHGRHARIELCPACALLAAVFPEHTAPPRPDSAPDGPS